METGVILALVTGVITVATIFVKKVKMYIYRSSNGDCNCVVGLLDKALPIKTDANH